MKHLNKQKENKRKKTRDGKEHNSRQRETKLEMGRNRDMGGE